MAHCSDGLLVGDRMSGCSCYTAGAAPSSAEGPASIKRIIVAVDGSPAATAAARWASCEAAMRNVDLTVVHVVPPAPAGWRQAGWPAIPGPIEVGDHQFAQGEKVLDATLGVIAKTMGPHRPRSITTRLCVGAVVPVLAGFTRAESHMIVVGRPGRDTMCRTLLGSVSSALVRAAHCPVAVVHNGIAPARSSGGPVVVGVDRSAAAERSTAIAFDEAFRRDVDVVVVHAIQGSDMRRAEEVLSQSLAGFQRRYPKVGVRRVLAGAHPADALLDESERAGLVVVGNRGRSVLTRKLFGSVSAAVIQACRIPVIVVRRHVSPDMCPVACCR
jgi:nucleotide-binding universal stress UspA family protein